MATSWTRHGSNNSGSRDPRLRGRLLAWLGIGAGVFVVLLLYRAYGQPQSKRTELVIRSAPLASATVAAVASVAAAAAPVDVPTPAPVATVAASLPATTDLLRPGTV